MLFPCLLIALPACSNWSLPATEMQHNRMENTRASFGEHFSAMVDSAVLHDMSLAEMHFIPNSDQLNGNGVARLDRMARFLNAYGGTVRYDARNADEELLRERMANVREYLSAAGVDMEIVQVALMMPDGSGRPGDEAVSAYQRAPGAGTEEAAAAAADAKTSAGEGFSTGSQGN